MMAGGAKLRRAARDCVLLLMMMTNDTHPPWGMGQELGGLEKTD